MCQWVRILSTVFSLAVLSLPATAQQSPGNLQIEWEVSNRFRLFAEQSEFDRHLKALDQAQTKSVLGVEQQLSENHARGWADNVGTLCYDKFLGRITERCIRDGHDENYLNPQDARIKTWAKLPPDFEDANCEWTANTGSEVQKLSAPCKGRTDKLRASTVKQTQVSVVARNAAGSTLSGEISIKVRDILVVGLGDSLASGEGNPVNPVVLDSEGFCFRRILDGEEFYLPGRADAMVNKSCLTTENDANNRESWDKRAAGWLFSPCHRSLYSYQTRTALALALENPKISVTLIPLGCTGATIREGLLKSKPSRERPVKDGKVTPADVEAQFSDLGNYLKSITKKGKRRPVDLVLLTIGANDMGFSGLVANIIINQDPERSVAEGLLVDPQSAQDAVTETLRPDFKTLRKRLRTVTGGNLERVILTAYGNPTFHNGGQICPATRIGFDAHPAFSVDGEALAKTSKFVDDTFLAALKAYATCAAGSQCSNPKMNRMTFVDSHFKAFGDHGFCAASEADPIFDRTCFKNGDSFASSLSAADNNNPLTCRLQASEFRPYAKRARGIRTVNDSYFAAMTYPTSSSAPTNIHDGRWGLEAVVYGGALHPTAEGHAAMADAALVAARTLLGMPGRSEAIASKK